MEPAGAEAGRRVSWEEPLTAGPAPAAGPGRAEPRTEPEPGRPPARRGEVKGRAEGSGAGGSGGGLNPRSPVPEPPGRAIRLGRVLPPGLTGRGVCCGGGEGG